MRRTRNGQRLGGGSEEEQEKNAHSGDTSYGYEYASANDVKMSHFEHESTDICMNYEAKLGASANIYLV